MALHQGVYFLGAGLLVLFILFLVGVFSSDDSSSETSDAINVAATVLVSPELVDDEDLEIAAEVLEQEVVDVVDPNVSQEPTNNTSKTVGKTIAKTGKVVGAVISRPVKAIGSIFKKKTNASHSTNSSSKVPSKPLAVISRPGKAVGSIFKKKTNTSHSTKKRHGLFHKKR